jgi:L-alanine-DL-glutamate epimerase-like enolase superfamily enzyme
MKIKGLETFTRDPIGLVRLRTDGGAEGWGQLSPFCADISAQVLHRQLAPLVLGADASDPDGLADRVIEGLYKFPGSYVCRALVGVDTALWDLRGKLEGKSVAELLGGRPRAVPVYASSMRRDITAEAEAERLKRLAQDEGYRAFKIKIGKVCGHDEDERPGRTEALVPAVRKALGDKAFLMADANSCYTAPRAIQVGRLLEAHGYAVFEEPCPYWEIEWTKQVADALRMDVSGGEQDCFLWQWRRIIAMRAVDIVQPDVCYLGGLSRTLRVARLAAEAGLRCVPHSANRSMVSVFTLHLMASLPNAAPFMECSIEPTKWARGVFEPPLEVRDGALQVPAGPGWGVTINEAWLASAERRESA